MLTEGCKKYIEYLDDMVKNTIYDQKIAEREKEITSYISRVFDQLTEENRKIRNSNLAALTSSASR